LKGAKKKKEKGHRVWSQAARRGGARMQERDTEGAVTDGGRTTNVRIARTQEKLGALLLLIQIDGKKGKLAGEKPMCCLEGRGGGR